MEMAKRTLETSHYTIPIHEKLVKLPKHDIQYQENRRALAQFHGGLNKVNIIYPNTGGPPVRRA